MNMLREPLQRHVSDFEELRERWYALVDSDVLDLLAKGHLEEALVRIESVVGGEIMDEVAGCV